MKKLLLLFIVLAGVGGGAAAGFLLKPTPEVVEIDPCGDSSAAAPVTASTEAGDPEKSGREYVKLNNQFVIPIVEKQQIGALVVISLSLEVTQGQRETVYAREPKLRDSFLQVMFDHANMGGFRGAFTDSNNLDILRRSLLNVAREALGPSVTDVLIVDIARQDG